jgi:hypothetical protein
MLRRKKRTMNQMSVSAAELTQVLDFKASFNAALYDVPFGNRMTLYLNTHLAGLDGMTLAQVNDPRECTAALVRRVLGLIDEAGENGGHRV